LFFFSFFWGTYLSCRFDIISSIDNILFNWRLDYCILKCSIFGEYYLSCLIGGILWVFSFLVNIYVIFNKSIFQIYLLVQKQQTIQNCESVIILHISMQRRIQDFKLREAHLRKLRQVEGGAKIVGVFRMKNHDFTPKNHFFPILAPPLRPPLSMYTNSCFKTF
jgi:hypothetical protein